MAFSLMLGVFLSTDESVTAKDRFGMAIQVFTPLVGIVGTILGFYFGSNVTTTDPLTILDVTTPTLKATAGDKLPLTILVQGGKGPWNYSLDFGTADVPKIEKTQSTPFLRENVTLPNANAEKHLGLVVTVRDASGATAQWSRNPEQWLTIAPLPTPPVPPNH